ncbi:hypothetical protein AMTRI_Chr09g15330 [Amborella trichopoda]
MYNVLIYMLLYFFRPKKSWSWISKQGKSLLLWVFCTTLAILVFIIASKSLIIYKFTRPSSLLSFCTFFSSHHDNWCLCNFPRLENQLMDDLSEEKEDQLMDASVFQSHQSDKSFLPH